MKLHSVILVLGVIAAGWASAAGLPHPSSIEETSGSDPQAAVAEQEAGLERPTLGPEAVDEEGNRGRIHTVVTGDTLWEISSVYLGTPWVWPSVWDENQEIPNPHQIAPGDRIWIGAGVMRRVTEEQAEQMLGAAESFAAVEPAAPSWEPTADEVDLMAGEELVPAPALKDASTRRTVSVAEREAMGFVASETIAAATSIVESPSLRTWLADGDQVYIGLGLGAVEPGDEFTIFREARPVKDLKSGRLLGYHVDILGWLIVREVSGEAATAEIRMSHSEIHRGDRLIPRVAPPPIVELRYTPRGGAGEIVFMPSNRTHMGSNDYVYLNRGALHGFEVGSEVEVFTAGALRRDRASGDRVMTPDHVDARMVLVEVGSDTSVAYVLETDRELEIGDTIRAAQHRVAKR
ncbi:MAG: LysM domain-containing protein [Myxococcota bacterium]|nr:LysM domain-containing protein [Myxococcota bacterium]